MPGGVGGAVLKGIPLSRSMEKADGEIAVHFSIDERVHRRTLRHVETINPAAVATQALSAIHAIILETDSKGEK